MDHKIIKNAFNKAAQTYDSAAQLHRHVADNLLQRLQFINMQPQVIVDVGAGSAYATALLKKQYVDSQVIALDFAEALLWRARQRDAEFSCIAANVYHLPFKNNSIDLIFSNFMLQWCANLPQVFAEIKRVLQPEGLFFFTSFGPDTLCELRAAWAEVDDKPHVHQFVDLHDIGDVLLQQGFRDPVLDREDIIMQYPEPLSVMHDLKALGAQNKMLHSGRGLTTPRQLQKVLAAYPQEDDGCPVTYEVLYGHAWGSDIARAQQHDDGSVSVGLDALKYR